MPDSKGRWPNRSLWDEANAALVRAGFAIEGEGALKDGWLEIYRRPEEFFGLYQLAEKLVDLDDALAAWRHKHMLTVERIIGMKNGHRADRQGRPIWRRPCRSAPSPSYGL